MPAKRSPSPAPPDRVEHYDRLVATLSAVARKGATLPYTSVNGNMFSYLDASGSMALRLLPADRAPFIECYDTALHIAHGAVQREYVTVPDWLLADTDALRPHFEAAYRYAAALPPKPTRRTQPPRRAVDSAR